jgi:hypothetical protein
MSSLLAPLLAVALTASGSMATARSQGEPEVHDPSLASKTSEELLACASVAPGRETPPAQVPYCGSDPWAIARELSSRGVAAQLMRAFESGSPDARTVIVYALYSSQLPDVLPFMESIAFGERTGPEESDRVAWAKAFLLKYCDQRVLREYSGKPFELRGPPGGSYEFSFLVPFFAKCRYAQSIPYLLWLLDAASLNVVGASEEALRAFYPNDKKFESLSEMKTYYARRYKANPKP